MSTPMNLVFKNGTDYLFAYCRHDGNSNVERLKSASVSDLKFIYDEIMKYKDVPGIFITHIANNLAHDDEPDQGTIAFDTWGDMDDDERLIIAFRGDSSIINKSMDEIYDYIQNTTDYHPLDIGGYTFYVDFDREKVAGTTHYKRSPRFIPMKQRKDAYRHYPSAHFDWNRDTGKDGLDKYTVPMDKSGILNTPDADSMHESKKNEKSYLLDADDRKILDRYFYSDTDMDLLERNFGMLKFVDSFFPDDKTNGTATQTEISAEDAETMVGDHESFLVFCMDTLANKDGFDYQVYRVYGPEGTDYITCFYK